ncbi:hypothetical protein AYO47_03730 [Planctomyces sp. SCGC AG-212-M04]|nr:hypothetical protein AYO47_03730 [Planctomyces sp. SCGC AG-212-M04]
MFRKLIPAVLGLMVAVQATSSFAGGMYFPYHNYHFTTNRVFVQPYPYVLQPQFVTQQYVIVKKWTPYGYVYTQQPLGLVRY